MKKSVLFSFIALFLTPFFSHAQAVDIIWQGYGYVPPFYEGRNLWGEQSLVKFVAIPQGLGDPSRLNYQWSINNVVLGSLSGAGKNSLTYLDNVLSRTQDVKVEIVNGGDILTSSQISLTPNHGQAYVYEDNPLYGILFNKEVDGVYQLKEAEVSFAAVPYFFSGVSRNDSKFIYRWQTNNGGTGGASSVTYRAPEGEAGSSGISVNISRTDKLIQNAGNSFLIQFNP